MEAVASYPIDAPNTQLALAGKPLYFSHDTPVVQDLTVRAEGLRSVASVPILYHDRVIGCFNLASHTEDEIPAFARQALETLTVEVGNFVVNLQAQEALRAGEEKFRQIADTINEAFWIFDNRQQKLVYLNPAYEKVWGISAEATYLDNRRYIEAVHPADRPILSAVLERQALGEQTEMEYRIVRPDGAVRWIFDRSFPIVDEDGQILRTTGVATDITERKLAEQSLQTRMEDLALINKLNAAVNRGENLTQITELLAEETKTVFGSVSASIYLLDRTKQRLVLQHFTMPPDTARRLEELSGRRLPQIELPLNGDDHFSRILATEEGAIYTGFDAICAWLSDFANTDHLPAEERLLVRKVIPAAAALLNISSVLSLPLKRGADILGLVELTSDRTFDASVLARLQNVRQQLAEIIARKQVDEALRESEEKYRSLAEASDAIIVLLDGEGCIHYLNERAIAVQGVQKTSRWGVEDTIDRTLYELLPAPIVDLFLPGIRHVIAADESVVLESPVGDKVYRTSIQPIHDDQGQAVLALLSATDITPLKQVQHELQELNRSLEERVLQRTAEVQDLYDNAPIGYHSLDASGCFVQVNQTELNWLGCTREELIGRSVMEILTVASGAIFQEIFPTFKQRGSMRDIEVELVRKDGSTFPVVINATALYDEQGGFVTSRSTLFDNTERKRTEQALRESEEQNRLLFENTPDAVVLFDEQGRIVRANYAFTFLAGLSVERCIGESMASLGLLPEPQVVTLAAAVMASLQSQGGFASAEFKITAAGGDARDVGVRVYGVPFGGRQHFLTSMRDITAEKQAEIALRVANAEIERALRMKDEFLANMSHELRTPLHGILAMTETLLDQIRGPLNERQQKSVRLIEESGQHLLALINDLLDLSKVEAGRLELHFESLLVDDVCQASLQFVRTMALKKEIRIEYANPSPSARLSADEQRLKQMLVNLLSNAVKFTPNGGRVELGVTPDPDAELIHFAVQDTGPGIALADQSRLFQPFVQIDSHLARQYEGTGLGLALVKRLAEQHGGTVQLDSSGIPGEGCRFTITLPYTPVPPPAKTDAAQPDVSVESGAAAPDSGPLLLLVEDNEVSITAVEEYMRHAGYRIAVARTGTEALELAAAITPDLILMDVQLPLLDGLEVTRRLRAQARFAATPIIAVTASAMTGDRERCLAAGATGYLSKPLRLKELLAMVKELIVPQHP